MAAKKSDYEPLGVETIARRLGGIDAVTSKLGKDTDKWDIAEIGDGNLNLVFILKSPEGAVIVKQALPYVRLVGDSWPLPLSRSFFEYHALIRQQERDPGSVPEIYHFDETQALIVMEYLADHTILRLKLIAGERVEGLAGVLGRFVARTAFRGSDLALDIDTRKSDTALFLGNVEICKITENLVFTDPYFAADMNHHTEGLDSVVAVLRDDAEMKAHVQHMMGKFISQAETMLHGDLHTGSIMCTGSKTRIIDPEFVTYGPMGFDLGMLLANFLMAFFSQPAHRGKGDDLKAYQDWICDVMLETVACFNEEFTRLWHGERKGILYPGSLFEEQKHDSGIALGHKLAMIRQDALGFCGIEMHRRTLSLAHNADFESIEDVALRAPLEARNILMGRDLIMQRDRIADWDQVIAMAWEYNGKDCL